MVTRVLHYGLSPNAGGIENYLLQLALHVDRDRFHFDFVYNRVGEPCFRDELRDLGATFYGITPRRESPRRNRRDLGELFERESFDILHCHMNTLSYLEPIRTALKHGTKVLVHSHNSGVSTSLTTNLLHRFHHATLPRDRITMIAVSQLAGNWLFGERATFEVINNGIEVGRFAYRPGRRDRVRHDLGLDNKFVVGNVGAFLAAKNHAFLLKTFQSLACDVPEAMLMLIGLGPLESRIRAQVTDLGLTSRVLFLGRRADIPDLLSGMDCLVFPSLHEGFPLVVLEAQAAGLPCFISDAITEEAVVTGHCWRIPLDSGAEYWASQIRSGTVDYDRDSQRDSTILAGLSVQSVAEKVQGVYVRMLAS